MSSVHIEMSGHLIRFGSFEVDMPSGELRRKGLRVKLQDQPRNILILLLERPGDLISREDLRQRLWHPDTFVDFDHSLNTAMMRLREALGDSSDHPHYIETEPRKGYRFIAPVQMVTPEVVEPSSQGQSGGMASSSATAQSRPEDAAGKEALRPEKARFADAPIEAPSAPSRRRLVLVGAAAALLVALAGSSALRSRWKVRIVPTPSPRISSIMVLPMESPGGVDKEKFADSMTDALTARLTQIPSLRVISRNTANNYESDHAPLGKLGHDLGVDAVVESTMVRSGDHVRITAELIQISTDRYLWASTYESNASDVLALQDQVIASIVDQIRIKVDAGQAASVGHSPRQPPGL